MEPHWYCAINFLLLYLPGNDVSSFIVHETEASEDGVSLPDHHCLYYLAPELSPPMSFNSHVTPVSLVKSIQIIDYCRRVRTNQSLQSHIRATFRFQELKQLNLTSEHLYQWSAPIDVIEEYQIYLDTDSNELGDQIFNNCSWT